MERTLISFNLPNTITIGLMAAAGYVLVMAVSQLLMNKGRLGAGAGAGGY